MQVVAIAGCRQALPTAHPRRRAVAAGFVALLAGCALQGEPVPAGQLVLPAGGAQVVLPTSCAWQRVASRGGGVLNMFGCTLESTRTRAAVATTQPVIRGAEAVYDARVAGVSDAERLQRIIDELRTAAGRTRETLDDFRASSPTAPPAQRGLLCRDFAYETTDRAVPGHAGEPFRTHLRGRTCLDPATRRPAIVHVSERHRLADGGPRADFATDAAAYLDSLRFANGGAATALPARGGR